MKYLVSLFFLLATVSFAYSQDEVIPRDTGLVKLAQAEVTKLFENVYGKWVVKARAWSSKINGYKETSGSASIEKRLNNNYVHEDFSLDWFGTLLHGEGFIRYSPLHQRFDFVQLDDFSSSPLKLIGTWDGQRRNFRSARYSTMHSGTAKNRNGFTGIIIFMMMALLRKKSGRKISRVNLNSLQIIIITG
jgi:hypothetical protein